MNWVLLLLFLAGCGVAGELEQTSVGALVDEAAPSTFECPESSLRCNSGSQYCLISKKGSALLTHECVELPGSCDACGCAQLDARRQFPATQMNCSEVIACTQQNARITVECSQQ